MTLGYLPQDGLALSGRTVFAECLSVFDELLALEVEYEQLTHTMSDADPKSKDGTPRPHVDMVLSSRVRDQAPRGRKQPSRSCGTNTPPMSCSARSGSRKRS